MRHDVGATRSGLFHDRCPFGNGKLIACRIPLSRKDDTAGREDFDLRGTSSARSCSASHSTYSAGRRSSPPGRSASAPAGSPALPVPRPPFSCPGTSGSGDLRRARREREQPSALPSASAARKDRSLSYDHRLLGTDGSQTHRWRGMDSNLQFRDAAPPAGSLAGLIQR